MSTAAEVALLASDKTGWADEVRAQRDADLERHNDPIVDAWDLRDPNNAAVQRLGRL